MYRSDPKLRSALIAAAKLLLFFFAMPVIASLFLKWIEYLSTFI